jgi:hypothetical protein
MKFMVLIKANEKSEAGVMPSDQLIDEMGKFNEEMVKAGVLLDVNGLAPSSRGARVKLSPDHPPVVTDGPFAETKELLAGYWLLEVKSREEAIEWVKRIPNPDGETTEIEIRWVPSMEDFAKEHGAL